MTFIASASTTSTASPAAIFRRWEDMSTWSDWNSDMEWVRLEGPFAEGSRGVLKPKGGPKTKFVIETLEPERRFVDTSLLFGARLVFRHEVTPVGTGSKVDVDISMSGPLAPLWNLILAKGFRASVQADLDALASAAVAAG